jgi:hypothetical protein
MLCPNVHENAFKIHIEREKITTDFVNFQIHVEIKFLNDPILPPSMVYFLYLPCQICGSERASPHAGIIDAQTHQKGTVSLGGGHPCPTILEWFARKLIRG